MLSLKGTETEKNLLKSFAGESQARNRYTFFASAAKKEGYRQISEIFLTTAAQEQVHAKRFFKFLEGGDLEITATYPAGIIGTTAENLQAAADGEYEEWSELYPHFAEVAAAEGFKNVAAVYKVIAVAEKHHEAQYRKLFEQLNSGNFFEREVETEWVCMKCGYVHRGKKALKVCPACLHPQGHFKVLDLSF
jgi:rubrerythrin